MDRNWPVYTIENECQDCYKCVRHCHAKAIRIVNAKASVIPDACVACGECVKICPAHAKMIRSDLGRLKTLLTSGQKVYASIAPSFIGYFKNITIENLAAALQKIGFAGVSETAIGAEMVSSASCAYLKAHPQKLAISSACPSCVDYIRKYLPEYTDAILPVLSPVLSHCKLLKETYGADIKTVFFGPCAAKKNEADRHDEYLNLALTFKELEQLFADSDLDLSAVGSAPLALRAAEEGRFYAIEGGMNDTLRDGNKQVRYLAISGLDNLARFLQNARPADTGGRTIFIEALACAGGCVNGPAMPQNAANLTTVCATDVNCIDTTSAGRQNQVTVNLSYHAEPVAPFKPTEPELEKVLAMVGKFSKLDELNCGACGYNSCRDFARALLEHKAEEAMCHNYLRKNFERTSNALIKYIPAGVVIVNQNLEITESNRNFAELVGQSVVFDNLGNLNSIQITELLPNFGDLFESVIANGGEIEKFNQNCNDKIVNISIFSIAKDKFAGAVIQDVTTSELQREQIAEKAKEIIRNNVQTVQQVARLFGEHIAESEILLNEIAGSYQIQPKIEEKPHE